MPTHGETQDQLVVALAAGVAAAFAHRVADVAEHEQIAERGAGKPGHVLRLAGDQPAARSFRPRRWRNWPRSTAAVDALARAPAAAPTPRSSARSTKLLARSASLASSAASISWTATVPIERARPARGRRSPPDRRRRQAATRPRSRAARRTAPPARTEPAASHANRRVRANHSVSRVRICARSAAAGQRFRVQSAFRIGGFEQSRKRMTMK